MRRLPPQQGFVALRYQPLGWLSWVEASVLLSGEQERLSGGDLTDERIGAARRRSDITDFFQGGLISPYILPGGDGLLGTSDDVFGRLARRPLRFGIVCCPWVRPSTV